jgi:hypothetical protein
MTTKIKLIATIVLLLMMTASCSKKSDDDPNTNPSIENEDYKLSSDVKIIGNEWENFVSEKTTDSIITLAVTQGLNLPQVGDILLKPEVSEKFPYGFLGRVTEIKKVGGTTEIVTESVALDEAFEELDVHFSENISKYVEEVYDANGQLITVKTVRDGSAIPGTKAADEVFLELPIDMVNGNISAKGKLRVALDFDFDLKIKNKKLNYLNVAVNPKFNVSADFAITVSGKVKDEIAFPLIPLGAIPAGPLVITPKLRIALVIGAEGKVKLQSKLEFSQSASYGIKYQNGTFDPYMESTSSDPFSAKSVFSLDGKVYEGARFSILCSFYGTNTGLGIGVTPKIAANAHFEIDAAKFAEGEFYDTFKEAKLKVNILIDGDIYIMAKIFSVTLAKYELYTPEFEIAVLVDEYLLPHFSTLEKSEVDENSVKLSYSIPNATLFPVEIGMAVYDDANNLVHKIYHALIHKEQVDFGYNFTFTNLDNTRNYYAVPLVKFGAFPEITATPKLNFKKVYSVGDFYSQNGVSGIIYQLADGGQHGMIISLQESNQNYYNAPSWCQSLGSGWYLPSISELHDIYTGFHTMWNDVNATISNYGGVPITVGTWATDYGSSTTDSRTAGCSTQTTWSTIWFENDYISYICFDWEPKIRAVREF